MKLGGHSGHTEGIQVYSEKQQRQKVVRLGLGLGPPMRIEGSYSLREMNL